MAMSQKHISFFSQHKESFTKREGGSCCLLLRPRDDTQICDQVILPGPIYSIVIVMPNNHKSWLYSTIRSETGLVGCVFVFSPHMSVLSSPRCLQRGGPAGVRGEKLWGPLRLKAVIKLSILLLWLQTWGPEPLVLMPQTLKPKSWAGLHWTGLD